MNARYITLVAFHTIFLSIIISCGSSHRTVYTRQAPPTRVIVQEQPKTVVVNNQPSVTVINQEPAPTGPRQTNADIDRIEKEKAEKDRIAREWKEKKEKESPK